MMKATTLLILVALLCFSAPRMVKAQEQGQSSQPSVQVTAESAPGVVNDLGIKNYLLGPGDVIDVRIFQQPDLSSTAVVDAEGNISSLPFIQPIRAQCRTEKDVAKDIIAAYSKFLQNPQVSVRITERNSRPPAIVHGAIRQPQRVTMLRTVHLNELIAVSGGFTERTNGNIQVLHTEKVLCAAPGEVVEPKPEPTLSIEEELKDNLKVYKVSDLLAGKEEANPVVRPGDVVTVMEAEPIYITGSVNQPQGVYLRDQLTLGRALAMVGGVKDGAKASAVHIYRQKPGSPKQEDIVVNYSAIKKNQQPDVLLQAYDIIDVPEASGLTGKNFLKVLSQSILGIGPSIMTRAAITLPTRVLY